MEGKSVRTTGEPETGLAYLSSLVNRADNGEPAVSRNRIFFDAAILNL
jgi:hypothetical protein